MRTEKEYNMDKIDDILQLDEHQIDDFLLDLKQYFLERKKFNSLIDAIAESVGASPDDLKIQSHGFVWKDDGKREGTIHIEKIEVMQ